MGDINLLGMIRKIKNSLSGFVSTSDKASKSAFGIVKIGDNISVSSGKISVPVATSDTAGVIALSDIPSGAITVDAIWTGTLTNEFVDITESLTHPISDYKFLAINRVNGVNVSASEMLYVPLMSSGANNQNVINYDNNSPVTIRLGDGTVSIKGTGTTAGITLIGIK